MPGEMTYLKVPFYPKELFTYLLLEQEGFLCAYLVNEHGVVGMSVLDLADHVYVGQTGLHHQHICPLFHVPLIGLKARFYTTSISC